MAEPPPYPGAPRWVKVLATGALAVVLLALIAIATGLGGPHGPQRHMQPAQADGQRGASEGEAEPRS